ncbi:type II toxin-antitoxin system RelE/ParE family toxin [Leptolyngbya boryana CZ1]|uniref:Type II toxin-antitoxin system RelE/ParE family toxin n=1 Tax=Leptolyngbya boryana CZ1 TaxID=3060204 RepID=A0AA96WXK1_LEPBY|nr:type II toxin-antitoxin system RelE/ParE family toxin [Leptolyngbya boryana]WNZ47068.1 type II toxin-antitoxin system RelE/ParE family toxin [Leptolyngbya boryana CZ1]
MAYQVVWSPKAIADVDAIAEYIARDSPAYASSVVDQILKTTRSLEKFPLSGRTVPEFGDELLREKIVYSYRILYQVAEDEVTIVTVIHGKRTL